MINFIHSDLISLEFLYVVSTWCYHELYVCSFVLKLLFSFSAKTQGIFLCPKFLCFPTRQDKTGASAWCSLVLPVACEVPRVTDPRSMLRHQRMVRKQKLGAMFPRPCSPISTGEKSWTTIRLFSKNKNLLCTPELVKAASSSWPSRAIAAPQPERRTPLRARAQAPLPQTLDEPLAHRAGVPAPLGASTPICHFKAAACRPCLPSATWMQWGRKI